MDIHTCSYTYINVNMCRYKNIAYRKVTLK